MLTPDQIYRRAQGYYPDFLRSLCIGQPVFPLALFGAGMAKVNDFAADREAIELLQKRSKSDTGVGYEIIWTERNFRQFGTQKIPGTVTFPTADDYVRFLRKQSEVRDFEADYALISERCRELTAWAQAKPLKVVAHAGKWPRLLDVCRYLQENPCPGCYMRELPLIVDTKFVENHRGILSEILPLAAPRSMVPSADRFEARFGFRFKQPLVRMRFLDRELSGRIGSSLLDLAVPLDDLCGLPLGRHVVLVVENEMTFLTLPPMPDTLAILGAGDAAASLARVPWLAFCRFLYWGDLDSHGFEILSNLRRQFPHVLSVLMDRSTFNDHAAFAVKAAATRTKQPLELVEHEQVLYSQLVEQNLLLEQEHIPDAYSRPRLMRAITSNSDFET